METSATIPVLCDRCRAEGFAGDDQFGEIRDLLAFTPVPRRAHADGWREEVQRGFIAALAVTGSPRRAARVTGRHCNGAEQLRRARGSASFAAAWDAAIELYRERELLRMKDDLASLAADQEQALDRRSVIVASDSGASSGRPPRGFDGHGNRDTADADAQDHADAQASIRDRLTRARRLYLMLIGGDPARRAAWEALVGPVDWARAERLEAQDDEPFRSFGLIEEEADRPGPNRPVAGAALPNMRAPDMLLTAEAGLIPDITGGPDRMEALATELERLQAAKAGPPGEALSEEEAAAVAAYRAELIADGWIEGADGNLFSPDDE